ncbi:hypothetical protein [Catelliglobosispora koreensis]|uniref:hypothetical protein n=1 Tax=Catelliglobosispora koreensis TaxID=129052 RepID=UPI0003738515|nr:hypothetical protein [Catelliglobosispora koreensis]
MTQTASPNRPLLDAAHALSALDLTPHSAWELIGQLQSLASGMNAIATATEDYTGALSEDNLDARVTGCLPAATEGIFRASIALQEARITFETLYTAHLATAETGVRQPTPPGFFGQPGQTTAAVSAGRSTASGLPADFPTPQQVQAMTLKQLREVSRSIGLAPGNQNKADLISSLEAYRFSRSPAARHTASDGPAPVVRGQMSAKPLLANSWGHPESGSPVCFHEDGEIGQAIRAMGSDRHLSIDDEPLANVLGNIASGPISGSTSSQEALNQLKKLRDRLPEGTRARTAMDHCVSNLDAPDSAVPDVPAVTPEPLRQLVSDLHAIPCVRREPAREQERLQAILTDFEHGRTRSFRLISSVRNLTGFRHELEEGWFDIRRAVTKAVAALEEALEKNRRSLIAPDRNQT